MKRDEIKGFRRPDNDEKKMIHELLWRELSSSGKGFTGFRWILIALEFLAFVKTADAFWSSGNPLVLLIGVAVAVLFWSMYKGMAKQQNFARSKYRALEEEDYEVKEVHMLSHTSDPNSYSGNKAYICDLDGMQCEDRILVDPKVAKVISRNGGRSLLMKLQNGTYFCLFAYAEDWKKR